MAQLGTIRFHQDSQDLHLQVEGNATMTHSLGLRRFVEEALAGSVRRLRFDLRRCTYMDSTFLGTLLFLQRASRRLEGGQFQLVTPSCQCADLLQKMGVFDMFAIDKEERPEPASWTTLPGHTEDKKSFQRNVVEAHEALATLPGAAGEPFRAVVRCLAKDRDESSR
jgi:anti-anti-sigma factor